VNHDVKNGLAPIRNVLRHLVEVAERDPAALARVLGERRATLEQSVAYLEQLARNYAHPSPALRGDATDPRPIVRAVADAVTATRVVLQLPDVLPAVRADAVVLQRILENLVANAVDALEGKPGTVTIGAHPQGDGANRRVRFTVADTGRGMTRAELDRALEGAHSTKAGGTGVGLAVVQRLIGELGGSLRAESAPGAGSTFTVEVPAS
jgi:signal transduction histidine kinase